MVNFLLGLFSILLVLLCCFVVLIVLMQRASSNGGMGSALGGGMAESALGADSGNVLTRWTIYASIAFFVICFGLYLGNMAKIGKDQPTNGGLPAVIQMEEPSNASDYVPGSLTEAPASEK